MAGEDVIVTIGIDASAANAGLSSSSAKFSGWSKDTTAALVKTEKAAEKVGVSVAKMDKPIDQAAASSAHLRAESEKLEKIASLLGPRLGGVVQIMSKIGKTAGSDVGGATLAIAGLAAGAGAALYAMGAFASGVLDTIENIDDLAASLDTVTRERLSEQIKSLRESKTAMDEFGESWTEMKIAVSGAVDGPLADLVTILGKSVEGWALMGEAVDRFVTDHPIAAKIIGINNPLSDMADLLKKVETNANAAGDALNREIDAAAEAAARDEQARRDARDRAASRQSTAPAPKAQSTANRGPSMAGFGGGVAASTEAELDALAASMIVFEDTTAETMTGIQSTLGAGFHVTFDAAKGDWKDLNDAVAAGLDHEVQLTEEAEAKKRAARQQAAADAIQVASIVATSITMILTAQADAQVAATTAGTKAHEKALEAQIKAQKKAAVIQALINGASAIAADIGKGGVAGALLAAADTFLIGTQIAIINSQPDKLHTGGPWDAPDERTVLQKEVTVMMTPEGARNRDGIAKQNAGLGGGVTNNYFVLPDSTVKARRVAAPRPGLAVSTPGARG